MSAEIVHEEPGPFASFKALSRVLSRARLPASAVGIEDADFEASSAALAQMSSEERAEWRELARQDLGDMVAVLAEEDDVARLNGELATLPDPMLDHLWKVVQAIEHAADRAGAPRWDVHEDQLSDGQKQRVEARYEAMVGNVYSRVQEATNSQVGVVLVPGFNWLFGAGLHVTRAVVYMFFWMFSKVRLNFAIVWVPLWVAAAGFDLVVFNVPWALFAIWARVVRGDNPIDRSLDRAIGCWSFGTSVQARREYAALRKVCPNHREFLDGGFLLVIPTNRVVRNAALSEVVGVTATSAASVAALPAGAS